MLTLKSNREFVKIYKKGRSAHSDALVLFFLPHKSESTIGFTASKKVGNAVMRNRAKRRMRALVLKNVDKIESGGYVFVAKSSTATTRWGDLERSFKRVLSKSGALK